MRSLKFLAPLAAVLAVGVTNLSAPPELGSSKISKPLPTEGAGRASDSNRLAPGAKPPGPRP